MMNKEIESINIKKLLQRFYVYDVSFFIKRAEVRSLIRDKKFKDYIDRKVFCNGVKNPRKSIEFLILGNWGKIHEINMILYVGDLLESPEQFNESPVIEYFIERMREEMVKERE